MPIDETQTIINNELYKFEVIFRRLNNDADPNSKPFVEISIESDHVNQFKFGMDVFEPVIHGELSYTDISYSTFPLIRHDGNCFMEVKIHRLTQPVDTSPIHEKITIFEHNFLITDVKLEDRAAEQGIYTVSFKSVNWFNFNNNVTYSSGTDKRSTEMIKDMLVKGGLKVENSAAITKSNSSLFFITPSTWSLDVSIKYLLSTAIDDKNGLYFLLYDHLTDKYQPTSLNAQYRQLKQDGLDLIEPANNIFVNTKEEVLNSFMYRSVMTGLAESNENGADHTLEYSKAVVFNDYNYVDRKWSQDIFTFNRVQNTLPQPQGTEFRRMVKGEPKTLSNAVRNFQIERVPVDFSFSERIRKQFAYSNPISFDVVGDLVRRPGQFLNILVGKHSPLEHVYSGFWYNLRVYHTFSQSDYYNTVFAARIDQKDVDIEQFANPEILAENALDSSSLIDQGGIVKTINSRGTRPQ